MRLNFRKSSNFNPKIHVAVFKPINTNRAFSEKNCNMISRKLGRGSKAVWNFSENSSVLLSSPVPKCKRLFDKLSMIELCQKISFSQIDLWQITSKWVAINDRPSRCLVEPVLKDFGKCLSFSLVEWWTLDTHLHLFSLSCLEYIKYTCIVHLNNG